MKSLCWKTEDFYIFIYIYIYSIPASSTDFLREISVILKQEISLSFMIFWPQKLSCAKKITKVWTRRNGGKGSGLVVIGTIMQTAVEEWF